MILLFPLDFPAAGFLLEFLIFIVDIMHPVFEIFEFLL